MKSFLAVSVGTVVAFAVIVLIALRLIASRVVSAPWMPLFDGVVSIALGAMSLGFLNPAGIPVIGLAFAAAGFLRESREGKRTWIFTLLAVGVALCAYTTLISLRTPSDYHP